MNISQIAIKRPIFVLMIVLLIITLGLIAYFSLPIDLMPNVDYPNVVVIATYAGASTEEMETLFVKPLENALVAVEGLDTLTSSSAEGVAFVVLQFKMETDVRYAELDVRKAVSAAQRFLPQDATEPTVRRFSTDDMPVIYMSLTGDKSRGDLRDMLENTIEPRLEGLPGVGTINIFGSQKKQIRVSLNRSLLDANNITYNQVFNAILLRNVSIPTGLIKGNEDITIRVSGLAETPEDIKTITLTTQNGKIIRVMDIAKVEQTLEDETTRARVNGKPAILFTVLKQSGENTLKVTKEIQKRSEEINKILPYGVKIGVVSDTSTTIQRSVSGVQSDILFGMILAILIVWIFLGNFRSTIITAIALPNSLLGAFILIKGANFSINTVTLMALSLAVGLLIDDSIVVRENIFRHIEEGETPKKAALSGTNEVGLAVISTTLSIMAVFIPISFMSGIIGKFFKEFGLTVAFALLISLLDAFTTAPTLSAYWYKDSSKNVSSPLARLLNKLSGNWNTLYNNIKNQYGKILEWSLNHKKTVIVSVLTLFILSILAVSFVGSNFINPIDSGIFSITMSIHPGSTLDDMDAVTKNIENFLAKQKDIEDFYSSVGSTFFGGGTFNQATINVDMKSLRHRKISTSAMVVQVRNFIRSNYGNQLDFIAAEASALSLILGAGSRAIGNTPLQVNIYGPNLDKLDYLSRQVIKAVSLAPGAIDAVSSFQPGLPEFVLKPDLIKAQSVGITAQDLGNILRDLIQGARVSTITLNDIDYDIYVQMNENNLQTIDDVKNIVITTKTGKKIPVDAICNIENSASPLTITHEATQRVVRVTANVAPRYAQADVLAAAKKNIDSQVVFPDGYSYEFAGQQKYFADTGKQMVIAMILAVLFMYMILASLYNSLVQPIYIMASLPLAFIGAFFGLLLTGVPLDIYGYIGLIMVLGLVAKNAILLVDFTNKKRKEGLSIREAILKAGPVRLRPILKK